MHRADIHSLVEGSIFGHWSRCTCHAALLLQLHVAGDTAMNTTTNTNAFNSLLKLIKINTLRSAALPLMSNQPNCDRHLQQVAWSQVQRAAFTVIQLHQGFARNCILIVAYSELPNNFVYDCAAASFYLHFIDIISRLFNLVHAARCTCQP